MGQKTQEYIQKLLQHHQIAVSEKQKALFTGFVAEERQVQAIQQMIAANQQIATSQKTIVNNWKEKTAIAEIQEKPLSLPNARAGKEYQFTFDLVALGLSELAHFELRDLEGTGLSYDADTKTLSGIPAGAGEYKIGFYFRHRISSEDAPLTKKEISLIVNADPKSLWKDLPSDQNDPYWKADTDKLSMPLCGKTLVVASKRGRSHAHEGKFRDDDFKAAELANGWGIVAVADGAGSAKFSRRGSLVACEEVVSFFREGLLPEQWEALEALIAAHATEPTADTQNALGQYVWKHMGQAAFNAHNALAKEAAASEAVLKDYSTTLSFALLKKFPSGYFITSFWVGDGGIGLYQKDLETVQVLGTPDGGEFAGQTRFLTMPEVFKSPDFYSRFSIKMVPDFTALVLMTDGITDPKFSTDANLARVEKWHELWADIQGANEDGVQVGLDASNEQVADQLLSWLDFWSPGNHDDRTIAVLF